MSEKVQGSLVGMVFARAVYTEIDGVKKKLYRAGEKIHPHDTDELVHSKIEKVEVVDFEHPDSLNSNIVLNCFEREEAKYNQDDPDQDEPTKEDALASIYSVLMPGEPITVESAEKDLMSMFFLEPDGMIWEEWDAISSTRSLTMKIRKILMF